MFSGLIQGLCQVKASSQDGRGGRSILVDLGTLAKQVKIGDSVAVNGVCLTVTAIDGTGCRFDVGPQTLACTSLGDLGPGSLVNIELALCVGDRLGGHMVQGHVDGIGQVRHIVRSGDYIQLGIAVDDQIRGSLIPKGSIAVDGVSLTIWKIEDWGFWVSIIPYTAAATTIGRLRVGDKVNIEIDMVVKVIRQHLHAIHSEGGLTMDRLRAYGFC